MKFIEIQEVEIEVIRVTCGTYNAGAPVDETAEVEAPEPETAEASSADL
jgi:hypothetical protein